MPKCKNCTNLYNLSDEDDVIVGKWCPKINDSPHEELERDCEHYQCMTNADRISAMSVDEMTEFIYRITLWCNGKKNHYLCGYCPLVNACDSRIDIEQYLNSKVKG